MTLKEKMQKNRDDNVKVTTEELQDLIKQIKDKFYEMQEKDFTKKDFALYMTWNGSELILYEVWKKAEESKVLISKFMDDMERKDILKKIAKYLEDDGANVISLNNRLEISIKLS